MGSKRGETTVDFDMELYDIDAVQRAAYALMDRCSIEIAQVGRRYRCRVIANDTWDGTLSRLENEVRSEVLDQVLRERIRHETTDIRNFILSLAFSRTGLIDSPD